MLSGWEIVALLAIVLVLFGLKSFPDLKFGFRRGLSEFLKASDEISHEAGRSIGGIFGKPASEALTPDNEVAELYEPPAIQNNGRRHLERIKNWLLRFRRRISRLFARR
jgi:Sec-independent protein translocase protein TatA